MQEWWEVPNALVVAVRTELERGGFSVAITDAELAWALFEPWERLQERQDRAWERLNDAASHAAKGFRRFNAAMRAEPAQ